MTGINRLLNWMEENKDLKISLEHIKLQAQVFALEETLDFNQFKNYTTILNKKINDNESKKQGFTSLSN